MTGAASYTTAEATAQGLQGSFIALVSTFMAESVAHMIPWLIVMFMVIICDLVTGVRKCIKGGAKVRFSRAIRDTMGKMITYTSFVIMVTLMNTAAGGDYGIDKWLCLFVCFVEICSILSNLLKPYGYNLNFIAIIRMLFSKVGTNFSREEWNEAIQKDKK